MSFWTRKLTFPLHTDKYSIKLFQYRIVTLPITPYESETRESKVIQIWLGNDTVQPCDTTQVRSDLDFGVKSATVQVYDNSYNYQSDRWIELKFYVDSPDMLSYYGLRFQDNQILGKHHKTGQKRLYEFCYLLPFDLWTSYLVRILFL
jgi:hypothetical protein